MFYYSRRPIAEGASGIGAWLNIMEFLAMVSIPTNFAAIYFSDGEGFGKKGQSPVSIWLSSRDEFWNRGNVILLIVAVEHALFVIKILLSLAIADVPTKVLADEARRVNVQKTAEEWLQAHKESVKGLTFEERVRKEQEQPSNGSKLNAYDRATKVMIQDLDN